MTTLLGLTDLMVTFYAHTAGNEIIGDPTEKGLHNKGLITISGARAFLTPAGIKVLENNTMILPSQGRKYLDELKKDQTF